MSTTETKQRRNHSASDAKLALQSIISQAEHYSLTSESITSKFIALKERFALPGYQWSYLSGYLDCKRDSWYRTHLKHGYVVNGNPIFIESTTYSDEERAIITGKNEGSGHFWKESLKPFFVSKD